MGLLRRRLSSQRRASYNNNNNNNNNIRNGGNDGYGIGRDRRNYNNNNNNNMGRRHNHVDIFTKLTVILCMYLIWASYTLSTKPNLRLQLKNKFQSLLLKGEQNIYNFLGGGFPLSKKKKKKLVDGDSSDSSSSSPSSSSSLQRQPRLRIPCGLIIAAAADNDKNNEKVVDDNTDKDKEIVLPLTTCIDLLSNDNNNDNNDNDNNNDSGISFLNEKIFQRYPQFKKYTTNSKDNNVIPSGIFHLRMGSIAATIDTSPELHIIKNTSTSTSTSTSSNDNNNNNNDNDNIDIDNIDDDCDLILGKQFWDNHFTEFNDDEIYLLTTSITSASSSSTSSKTSPPLLRRVMVPYIRIRQPLFLFDDNDIGNDNSDL